MQVEQWATYKGPIDTWIIAGHGDPTELSLGPKERPDKHPEETSIDLDDESQLVDLRGYFVNQPTLIFLSCSTGQLLIDMFHRIFGGRAFAPLKDALSTGYTFDHQGRIREVYYTVPTRRLFTFFGAGKKSEDKN